MTTAYRLMANEPFNPLPFDTGLLDGGADAPPPFRALEMIGVLQTTLDLGRLMGLFMREMQARVEFDGLRYRSADQDMELTRGELSRHSVAYGLTIREQRLGELSFFRDHPFQQNELRTLEDLLAALLYPLRNTLAYRQAILSALVDSLTGVNNRAAMDVVLHREVELSRRRGTALAVILLDVDFFKKVNDNFGHTAGDACLQAVARCVQDSIRSSDLLFRCGGEEFLVLLSQTEPEGAVQLAERIRHNVQQLRLPVMDGRHLTVSLGATDLRSEDDAGSIYQRADRALYKAKQGGRNRVEIL
jgi:diguanylate cyclase (GGDEF)-like protein